MPMSSSPSSIPAPTTMSDVWELMMFPGHDHQTAVGPLFRALATAAGADKQDPTLDATQLAAKGWQINSCPHFDRSTNEPIQSASDEFWARPDYVITAKDKEHWRLSTECFEVLWSRGFYAPIEEGTSLPEGPLRHTVVVFHAGDNPTMCTLFHHDRGIFQRVDGVSPETVVRLASYNKNHQIDFETYDFGGAAEYDLDLTGPRENFWIPGNSVVIVSS